MSTHEEGPGFLGTACEEDYFVFAEVGCQLLEMDKLIDQLRTYIYLNNS